MKMASRSIDLISKKKKTNCTCSTLFFLISNKTNLHVQHAFCLSLPLFCTTTTLFCRTKLSKFQVTHYFYGGIAHFTVTVGNEAGVDLVLIQPFLLYYVKHVFLMLTSIF